MMRVMPYRTLENMIDGVVMTFVDITESKTLEAELRKTQADLYHQIGERSPKPELRRSLEKQAETTPRFPPTKAGPPRK